MHPICFRFDGLTIYWYGVAMAVGFMAGLANWVWLGKKENRSPAFSADLLFVIMVSGILGARIAYVLLDLDHFLANPIDILLINKGGLIFYGGFAGGLAGIILFARRKGERPIAVLDFVAVSVPLAHAIGRIGCFMNGCCHGRTTDCACGVSFPSNSPAWWDHVEAGLISSVASRSLVVHPTQLYEAVFNLLLYAALVFLYRRRKLEGTVTAAYLMGYGALRFMLEYLRADIRDGLFVFSLGQVISAGLFIAGLVLLLRAQAKEGRAGA